MKTVDDKQADDKTTKGSFQFSVGPDAPNYVMEVTCSHCKQVTSYFLTHHPTVVKPPELSDD